jgi:8-oxo-dGTP pyrophosphatase MutT (NUDIX family)
MAGIIQSFDAMAALLAKADIVRQTLPGHTRAAVALVIGRDGDGYRILFIERAAHPGDPWSGNIGFPGGKVENGDNGCRSTAERETREELGLDLSGARLLGRLSDVHGAHLPVLVSCFVYGVENTDVPLVLSDEVKDAFWLPVDYLVDPRNKGVHEFSFAGDRFQGPCIVLPYPDKPVLWGLTHRLLMELLAILAVGV